MGHPPTAARTLTSRLNSSLSIVASRSFPKIDTPHLRDARAVLLSILSQASDAEGGTMAKTLSSFGAVKTAIETGDLELSERTVTAANVGRVAYYVINGELAFYGELAYVRDGYAGIRVGRRVDEAPTSMVRMCAI
jgi:hypothetical protein